jgi:hypothetical protein
MVCTAWSRKSYRGRYDMSLSSLYKCGGFREAQPRSGNPSTVVTTQLTRPNLSNDVRAESTVPNDVGVALRQRAMKVMYR